MAGSPTAPLGTLQGDVGRAAQSTLLLSRRLHAAPSRPAQRGVGPGLTEPTRPTVNACGHALTLRPPKWGAHAALRDAHSVTRPRWWCLWRCTRSLRERQAGRGRTASRRWPGALHRAGLAGRGPRGPESGPRVSARPATLPLLQGLLVTCILLTAEAGFVDWGAQRVCPSPGSSPQTRPSPLCPEGSQRCCHESLLLETQSTLG